jgi:ATP-dependent RNA circularization protein (DNA/RNA ligase family)
VTEIKYPRTKHLPNSPGYTDDDERLADTIYFKDQPVIVTEKLDGENSTINFKGTFHARSIDSRHSPWQTHLATEAARIASLGLPETYHICGENMYAKHSIEYDDLETFFYVFSIWDDNYCLPWEHTLEWLQLLDLKHPPIFYEGIFDIDKIQKAFEDYRYSINNREVEGYVVRRTHGFLINAFAENVCKYVRSNHVTTDKHWTTTWSPNKLKNCIV